MRWRARGAGSDAGADAGSAWWRRRSAAGRGHPVDVTAVTVHRLHRRDAAVLVHLTTTYGLLHQYALTDAQARQLAAQLSRAVGDAR